jgi:DNA sulfur modification protein DndB
MVEIARINDVTRRIQILDDGSKREYFLGQISSSLVGEATFVPVIADEARKVRRTRTYLFETDNGYQRPGSSKRMEGFARYLMENKFRFSPSVVLSGRDLWQYDEKTNSISVRGRAAIIDGQHRTGGYVAAYLNDGIDRMLDFVVLNVSIEEEEQLFLDINSNAKSVSTGIVSVLGRSAGSLVAEELNSNPDSIFLNRFYIAQKSPGTLFNIASVAKEVGTTFSNGVFEDIRDNVDIMFEIMSSYWEIIADAFPDEWRDMESKKGEHKLLELTGLMAFSLAANELLAPAYDIEKMTVDYSEVEARVSYVSNARSKNGDKELDLAKDGLFQGRTGYGGAGPIHSRIQQIIARYIRES